ncbi:MAG TPA: response regulator [Dongiaceae bacterium]|nr:response regulator [Dongiaceae bacterium]
MRVLLIEDDAPVRRIVRKMLERERHEVTEAENGRVGLDRLRESAFDLVLTDIVMPEMDGLETLIELRKDYPDLKVIAMSGGGRTGNMDFLGSAEKLGASAVLSKPFTIDVLATAIARAGVTARI